MPPIADFSPVPSPEAFEAAEEAAHELSPHAIQQMHAVLMEGQDTHTPGQWRTEPVWIGSRHDSPVGADYVALNSSHIPDLMEAVVAFSRRFDVSALVSVAVAYAQFETIHPFTDGNGRTGRAFAQAILRYRGSTRSLAVPVSAGLLVNAGGYFDVLTAYRQGDISPIVQSLADAAMQQPAFTAADAAGALGVQLPNVNPPLRTLTDAGILKYKREYQSPPLWRSEEILAAIDRFAQRAGRRAGI